AGVVPCPGGWLEASAKLQGITMFPEEPEVAARLIDVLDHKPAYDVIALHAPIGLPASYRRGGRACEREARQLLGWPRSGAILPAPPRPALSAKTFTAARRVRGVSAVTWVLMPKLREVANEIQPYWQRTVFEVHPELSFFQ